MFRDGSAAFHPVAAIDVGDAEIVMDGGVMNMAANHAVRAASLGLEHQCLLEFANVIDGVLDLSLRPLGQRPIAEAEAPAQVVENTVNNDSNRIGVVAQMGEPARLRHHEVEMIAMDDQIAASIGAITDIALGNLNATG